MYAIKRRLVSSSQLFVLFDNLTFYYLLGPLDNQGYECPVSCPENCAENMMSCPDGDDGNGCMMPDFCMPITGNSLHMNLSNIVAKSGPFVGIGII